MEKMYKLCEVIENEIEKIADKGLTTANLDTAYKLIDMYKDLKNMDYWEQKGEYYEHVSREMRDGYFHDGEYSHEDDYSMRGRRGRYDRYSSNNGILNDDRMRNSRNHPMGAGYSMYDKYMTAKKIYRSGHSSDGKRKLMASLEDYMDDFTEKIKEMHRDADTQEERELISKFMNKLQHIQ